jgi:hypothetical protein
VKEIIEAGEVLAGLVEGVWHTQNNPELAKAVDRWRELMQIQTIKETDLYKKYADRIPETYLMQLFMHHEYGRSCDGIIYACLCNRFNYIMAFVKNDPKLLKILPHINEFLMNELHADAWGSPVAVDNWRN